MKKPIIIAHLIATNFFGGPEKQILAQSMRLSREYFYPVMISYREEATPNSFLDKSCILDLTIRELKAKNSFDPKVIKDLCSIIRADDIHILCAHGYKSNIIGRLATWITGIPYIAISRGWTAENTKIRLYEKLDKLFLHFADHVVAVSHGQREKILSLGVSPEKVSVIHNAINLAEIPDGTPRFIRQQLGVPDDAIIVASAGRLSPEKNYAGMIEAACEVVKHNPSIYFVIFGEGFLRPELEAKINSAGLNRRFLLPGFRTDLQQVLSEIDIFMLPSFTEGLPNVILEAFAACKPVVATMVGGTPEVVQDGVSGFLARPEEYNVLSQHILTLANDAKLRQKMGEAGFQYVHEKFGFEKQTSLYEQLYQKISASQGR